MRSELFYLALPVTATMFNVFFAMILSRIHPSRAQPVIFERMIDRCVDQVGDECIFSLDDYAAADEKTPQDPSEPEEDPMLKKMPGVDFNAYVRADIATFYQKEPGTMTEKTPAYNGQAGKFVNMSPETLTLWWEGPNGPVLNGNVGPWAAGGTACFPHHNFIFTMKGKPDQVLARCQVVPGTSVYYFDQYTADDNSDPGRCKYLGSKVKDVRKLSPEDRKQYNAHKYNLVFGAMYKNFTGGSEWLTMYPKNPPRHHIWRADYFGQEHQVVTPETQFREMPPKDELHRLKKEEMRHDSDEPIAFAEYREPGALNLTIKAMSCAPRAFAIEGFLSDTEVDHILDNVQSKHRLERSTTNGHKSSTRTSSTTWVNRAEDPVLDAIFRRVGDVLRIDEALLRDRLPDERPDMPTRARINEDLQIVHYYKGQEYTAHHDFGYPTGHPDSPSRSINLCMYLNDVAAGGQTSFPRWRTADTTGGLNVTPKKGTAMIFYMVNPDGNLDDLTHHAALPVIEGEKWFSNLWIHDPIRT